MLRDAKLPAAPLAPAARWVVLGAVFACAVLVAGLRGPSDRRQAIAVEAVPAAEAPADAIDVSWVPSDAVAVAAFRPAAIFRRPEMKQLGELFDEHFAPRRGTTMTDIEQFSLVLLHEPDLAQRGPIAFGVPVVMLRFTDPDKAEEAIRTEWRDSTAKEYEGASYRVASQGGVAAFQPDDRTIIAGPEPDVQHVIRSRGGPLPEILGGREGWKAFQNDHAVAAADASVTTAWFQQMNAPNFGAPFAPLWEDATRAVLGIRLDNRVKAHVLAASDDEQGALSVEETLKALLVLARNWTAQLCEKLDERPENEPGLIASARAAMDLATATSIRREGTVVRAQASGDLAVLDLSKPSLTARRTQREVQSMNNLKQIAIAMHNFHDTWRCLPPAVLRQALPPGASGESQPYSWRVALLPYLEQAHLYEQYRFDQPWDSPANREVLRQMPAVYRSPGDPPDSKNTSCFVLVGPDTVFGKEGSPPLGGTEFAQIRDGMSNTIMIVEAKRAVPWTKPEDIPYDPEKPLPELGGHFEGEFLAALCDGSVRFLPNDLDQTLLRRLCEKSDGQPVNLSEIRER